MSAKLKILHLSLKKEPFEVMVTGEKNQEFRKPTKWILSRLYNKDGTPKHYDVVKFTNGYGKDKPQFVCEYKGLEELSGNVGIYKYSNGFEVNVVAGDIIIRCGKIGIKRNIK